MQELFVVSLLKCPTALLQSPCHADRVGRSKLPECSTKPEKPRIGVVHRIHAVLTATVRPWIEIMCQDPQGIHANPSGQSQVTLVPQHVLPQSYSCPEGHMTKAARFKLPKQACVDDSPQYYQPANFGATEGHESIRIIDTTNLLLCSHPMIWKAAIVGSKGRTYSASARAVASLCRNWASYLLSTMASRNEVSRVVFQSVWTGDHLGSYTRVFRRLSRGSEKFKMSIAWWIKH